MHDRKRSSSTEEPSHDSKSRFERERSRRPDEQENGIPLSRVQESLLEDETRKAIMEELRRTAGQNKSQLRKRLGILRNLLEFHLERLEEKGLVETLKGPQGQEVLCFVRDDAHLWAEESTRILFGREPVRLVGIYIAQHPGCSSQEIADALELKRVSVQHHLRSLHERGLIERTRIGRSVEYDPLDVLTEWSDELAQDYELPWDGKGGGERGD